MPYRKKHRTVSLTAIYGGGRSRNRTYTKSIFDDMDFDYVKLYRELCTQRGNDYLSVGGRSAQNSK